MVNKINAGAGRLFAFLTIIKLSTDFAQIKFIYFLNEMSTTDSLFIIYQISKSEFYVFWRKTCRNLKSIKFANSPSIT